MNLDQYQLDSRATAIYPAVYIKQPNGTLQEASWIYPALGLGGESGETLEKVKKLVRDSHGIVTPETAEAIKKELGDILWYVAQIATEFGLSLGDVARTNLQKLRMRQSRGVLTGNGDNR